jgi:hypothetical protein
MRMGSTSMAREICSRGGATLGVMICLNARIELPEAAPNPAVGATGGKPTGTLRRVPVAFKWPLAPGRLAKEPYRPGGGVQPPKTRSNSSATAIET